MNEGDLDWTNKLSLSDLSGDQIRDKRVLLRVDYNVPMKDGKVSDIKRMEATIPTIEYLTEHGAASVVLMSQFGRPNGFTDYDYSLN